MGIIWDIVKEVPLSGVLKEKIIDLDAKLAGLETENSILQGDLRKANLKISQLTDENKRLTEQIASSTQTEQPFHEIAVKILRAFGTHSGPLSVEVLFGHSQASVLEFKYYLQELLDSGYLDEPSVTFRSEYEQDDEYELTQKGRGYLMKISN